MARGVLDTAEILEDRVTGYGREAARDRVTGTASQTAPQAPPTSAPASAPASAPVLDPSDPQVRTQAEDDIKAALATYVPHLIKVVERGKSIKGFAARPFFVVGGPDTEVQVGACFDSMGADPSKVDPARIAKILVTASGFTVVDQQCVFLRLDSVYLKSAPGKVDPQIVLHELAHLAMSPVWLEGLMFKVVGIGSAEGAIREGVPDLVARLASKRVYASKKDAPAPAPAEPAAYADVRDIAEELAKTVGDRNLFSAFFDGKLTLGDVGDISVVVTLGEARPILLSSREPHVTKLKR